MNGPGWPSAAPKLVRFAVVLGIFVGSANGARADVSWSAPDGCPSEASVTQAVLAAARRPIDVHAVVSQTEGAFAMQLDLDGGSRMLHAPTCEELAETIAVLVAIASAPDELPAPEVAAATHAPAGLGLASPVAGVPTPLRCGIAAAAVLDIGTTSQPAAGALLGLELDYERLRLSARATVAPPVASGEWELEQAFVALAVDAGAYLWDDVVRLALFGGPELAVLWAVALGVRQPEAATEVALAIRGGGLLAVPLGSVFELFLDAVATAYLSAPRFVTVDEVTGDRVSLHATNLLSFRASTGLVVRIP